MSTRTIILAPRSLAAAETFRRMADVAYGDYLTANIAYNTGLATGEHAAIRQARRALEDSRELMRMIIEAGGMRNSVAHAAEQTLSPEGFYELHLMGDN